MNAHLDGYGAVAKAMKASDPVRCGECKGWTMTALDKRGRCKTCSDRDPILAPMTKSEPSPSTTVEPEQPEKKLPEVTEEPALSEESGLNRDERVEFDPSATERPKMGRPSMFDQKAPLILSGLRSGKSLYVAIHDADIGHATADRWLTRGRQGEEPYATWAKQVSEASMGPMSTRPPAAEKPKPPVVQVEESAPEPFPVEQSQDDAPVASPADVVSEENETQHESEKLPDPIDVPLSALRGRYIELLLARVQRGETDDSLLDRIEHCLDIIDQRKELLKCANVLMKLCEDNRKWIVEDDDDALGAMWEVVEEAERTVRRLRYEVASAR